MRIGFLTFLLVLLLGVCPQGSLGQTCTPTVEVPAFMTIKVGETKDWDVEFCNKGPDTAGVDWTLTPGGCDPRLQANPTKGDAVLVAGECKTHSVKVKAPDNVCAKHDADFPVVAVACKTSANDLGKICILPTGEKAVQPQRPWTIPNGVDFDVYLLPTSAKFIGRTVHEIEKPGSHSDGCAVGDVKVFHLTGSSWKIVYGGYYEKPDSIGYPGINNVGKVLEAAGKVPCSVVCKQQMFINCTSGPEQFYWENDIRIDFNDQGLMTVTRGGTSFGPF